MNGKIPNSLLTNFVSQNKCICDDYQMINLVPRDYEDIYEELYKRILYNLIIIKNFSFNTDTLGKITNKSKLRILFLIKVIDKILTSFSNNEKYYSLYGNDKIFYICIPFYIDYNQISYIKISNGVNFMSLIKIIKDTGDIDIRTIVNEVIEKITYYLII
jgi:hypothetical protein